MKKIRQMQAERDCLPNKIIAPKNNINKERPFFYRHLMQNTIHDPDGENSKSLARNIYIQYMIFIPLVLNTAGSPTILKLLTFSF